MKKKGDEKLKKDTGVQDNINRLVRTEEALRESEIKYQLLFESASDAILLMDQNIYIDCNQKTLEMFGCTKEQIIGQSPYRFSPEVQPDGKKSIEKGMEKINSAIKGQPQYFEWRHCRYDGILFDAEISLNAFNDKGKYYIQAIVRDVNERKQAQETLRQSEEKYRNILENIQEGYYEVDLAGNLTFFNNPFCRIYGYSKEELMGMNYRQYTEKEHSKELFQAFNKVYSTGEPTEEFDWQAIRKDGTKIYVELSASLQKDSSGKPIGFRGIVRDVTERKRVEDILRRQTDAMDSAIDGMAILNAEGEYIYLNKAHVKIYGYENEGQFLGKSWRVLYDSDVIKRFEQEFMPELSRKGHWFGESIGKKKNGSKFPQAVSLTAMANGGLICVVRDITERKQIEYELRTSEINFRHSLDDSPLGVRISSIEGETIYANRAILDMYGYDSIEELKKISLKERYTPGSYAEFLLRKEKRLRGELGPSEYEISIVRKNGEIRHLHVFRKKIFWDGKKQFQVIYQDITERRQAEEAQKNSEKKYRDLYDFLPIPVYEMDFESNITSANNALYEKFGGTEEDLKKGFNAWQLLTPETIEKSGKNIQRLLNGEEQVISSEYTLKKLDGSEFPAIVISSLIYIQSKPVGLRGAIIDITERKRAEDALFQSEEKYRTILENIEEGYFEVDLAGSFTFVNDSTCSFLGYSKEEIMGMNNRQYTDKETAKEVFQTFNRVYNTGKTAKGFDWQIIRKDGTKRYIEASISLQKDSSGKPKGFRGIVRDITERKQAEKELRRVNRALRMLSATNQALIHITDEATLLNEICRIAVEVGVYRMAWISSPENDEAKTMRPVAHAGFESGYIESANITWADNERGRGPIGTAIRTGQPSIARNILLDPAFALWREAAIQRGYKSNIALPLISEGQTLGALTIYSVEADAFDANEVEILKELADDLAFGITALRTRAQRDQTEAELSESEERYRLIAENTADTINVFDLNFNKTYVSPSILKLRGYTVQETMTQTLDQMLTPDSLEQARKVFAEQMALESSGTADPARTALMELEEYCKDGSTLWVEVALSFLRDNNLKPTGILTLTRNITERKHAEEQLRQSLGRLKKAVGTTIAVLGTASEVRDPYTAGHQKSVADLARTIATEMRLAPDKIEGIRMAGSIHDIGKLSIPAEILSKPTKLTDLEFSLIKEHPRIGYEMLKDVESPWPLAEIVYQHHERINGSGYPRNLKGDDILIEARIMAVSDVVEAMASHRPYRPGLGIEAALEEIEKNKGILYDNVVADACLKLFREKGYQLK